LKKEKPRSISLRSNLGRDDKPLRIEIGLLRSIIIVSNGGAFKGGCCRWSGESEGDFLQEKIYASFGIVGPIIVYLSIGVSIMFSPWFSWERNALSDLGHVVKSEVAPIFNLGLLLGGLLLIVYVVTVFREHAKYTSVCLVASSFLLQLIATFDEAYGFIHGMVSVLFFVSIWIASLVNTVEKRSLKALIAFIVSFGIWVLYAMRVYSAGIAVPEIISFTAVAALLMLSAIRIYSRIERTNVKDRTK